ncbi:hypothetical protein C4K40_4553 [Pseudomonas sp. CMR5c]|nr:hypothetical protein C4K40_4553 [Pseudomonas sp. CMR5c]
MNDLRIPSAALPAALSPTHPSFLSSSCGLRRLPVLRSRVANPG